MWLLRTEVEHVTLGEGVALAECSDEVGGLRAKATLACPKGHRHSVGIEVVDMEQIGTGTFRERNQCCCGTYRQAHGETVEEASAPRELPREAPTEQIVDRND